MAIVPNTVVRLLTNVPLSNNYDHTRDFNNIDEQTNYFTSKTYQQFFNFSYQRQDQAVKVPINVDDLYNVNYLMYQNRDYSTKWFYAFVTRKEYINPNTTAIYFQIDVFQTWLFDFELLPSYVIREHANRWLNDGSPVLNTIEEGLDYGTDYDTVHVERLEPNEDVLFLVVVTKQPMHASGGEVETGEPKTTLNGIPQPLNYYVHPFKTDGSTPNVRIGGNDYTGLSNINVVFEGMYAQEEAVNNVVSMYITEFIDGSVSYNGETVTFLGGMADQATISDDQTRSVNTIYITSMNQYNARSYNLGNKYNHFKNVEESKLYMYPYCVTILDDLKGNRLEVKNEYIRDSDINITVRGSLGTSNKVSYELEGYNTGEGFDHDHTGLENSVINNNPNDLPILSEMLSAYLQGNKNTLQNQKSSMMFSALTTTLGGAIGGGIGGGRLGVFGAIGGAATGAINSYYQIEGLNAKQKDIQNTPPQLVNMGGNSYFDFGHNIKGLYVIKKQIKKEYRDKLTNFFKMYGYKVNQLKKPNLKTRQHYNFIHTADVHIKGNIPNEDKSELSSIFNSGITIWHGDYVGDYSKENGEVE